MTENLQLSHEQVDDVPLLPGLMQRLGIPAILDRHLGNHGNHQGIGNGWLAIVWFSYITLGEEWDDASAWLLGNEWDSVMNYRFRSALLSWLATGCSGNGCSGGVFQENDSNNASSSGPISMISPSQFNARLRAIAEDYPPMALQAMMNLAGSHDTNRLRFLLRKVNNDTNRLRFLLRKANNDNDSAAVQRMKEWWLFSFTYPGAPTIYYGDEIGLNHDGVWSNNTWEDDPYNRVPFPWPDATGNTYGADAALQAFARQMASIYWSYQALQDGAVQHGMIVDDANKLYGYGRTNGSQAALIVLNRSDAAHNATFTGLNAAPYNLPDGTQLVNALSGDLNTVYTVSGGAVTISVPSNWGVIMLEKNEINTPAAVSSLDVALSGGTVTLTWATVNSDTGAHRELVTGYAIHNGSDAGFAPTDGTRVATVTPSDPAFRFGASDARFTWSGTAQRQPNAAYHKVCTVNAAGVTNRTACPTAAPLAVTLASFDAQAQFNHVQVTWETVSELNNTGFNLYRTGAAAAQPGAGDLLAFVPSQAPGASQGAAYRFPDGNVVTGQTYWYWLADVDLGGAPTLHGPVGVTYDAPTAVRLTILHAGDSRAPAPSVLLVLLALSAALLLAAMGASRRTTAV